MIDVSNRLEPCVEWVVSHSGFVAFTLTFLAAASVFIPSVDFSNESNELSRAPQLEVDGYNYD